MDRQKLAKLREERAAAYNTMTEVLESAEGALSAEDQEKYDRAEGEFDSLDGTIQREERAASRSRASAAAEAHGEDAERAAAQEQETRSERFERAVTLAGRSDANLRAFFGTPEYREAFREGILRNRSDVPEYRTALALAVDANGGATAPVEFVKELLVEAADFSVVRQFANVIATGHGRDMEFPTLATKGTAGWTDEVTADPDAFKSEPTFGAPKVVKAYPAQREVVTSKDLLQDSVFDIEALIRALIAESFSELEAAAFWTGDGNGKPRGIVPGLDAAKVVTGGISATAVISADDLIDVQHKPRRLYRQNARWYLNDETLKIIRKLRDANDVLIWQPGLTDGEPGRILGKPYEVDEFVPDAAPGATSIVYGDLSGYMIRDVLSLSIQRLNELYARSRQVGFLADKRVDGVLLRPERVAAFKHGAAA